MNERGSASLLVVALAVPVVLAGVMAIGAMGAVIGRAQVAAAADAAALAAANPATRSPCSTAADVARSNGARLVHCVVHSGPPIRAGVIAERSVDVPVFGSLVVRVRAGAEYAEP